MDDDESNEEGKSGVDARIGIVLDYTLRSFKVMHYSANLIILLNATVLNIKLILWL